MISNFLKEVTIQLKDMKKTLILVLLLTYFVPIQAQDLLNKDNLMAWCIVPFDKLERGPKERIDMLKELGINQYAYDWREKHIDSFNQEINLAQEADIAIEGVWLWIDENTDSEKALSTSNMRVIDIVKNAKLETDFWVGFQANFFAGLTHQERVNKGVAILKRLQSLLEPINSNIMLYNHGDWFGEPENQVEIIEAGGFEGVGLIYSFHHGHHQYNRFPSMLESIMPYLKVVNLNGMDIDKKQILSIGKGKYEKEMIDMLLASGFSGRIGILGHREDEDVKLVLQENLDGLKELYD